MLALRNHPTLEVYVCVTAQHRQMLNQVPEVFGVVPDADLDLMQPGQTLGGFTSRAVAAVNSCLAETKPDMVLVQGDTKYIRKRRHLPPPAIVDTLNNTFNSLIKTWTG